MVLPHHVIDGRELLAVAYQRGRQACDAVFHAGTFSGTGSDRREAGAIDGMREAIGSYVGGCSARLGRGDQHGTFGHHAGVLLHLAPAGFAFYATAASGQRVVAALPVDGVGGSRDGTATSIQWPVSVSAVEFARSLGLSRKSGACGASPTSGAFAAESGIGEQADGGFDALAPLFLRSVVGEFG